MSLPTINKANEILLAGNYPAFRLNQRERKVLQTAEEYAPAIPSNWGSTPPATLSAALDALATSGAPSAFGMRTVSAVWDFSVNGGAIGTMSLGVSLPSKAIVAEVIRDIETTADSTGHTGTIQLVLPTDGALEQSALAANGSDSGQASSGGTALPKKATAARALSVTIATAALTVGKIRYFVRYYQGE